MAFDHTPTFSHAQKNTVHTYAVQYTRTLPQTLK